MAQRASPGDSGPPRASRYASASPRLRARRAGPRQGRPGSARGDDSEGKAQHDRKQRGKRVNPEDPRRLPPELAEPGAVELKERRIAQASDALVLTGSRGRIKGSGRLGDLPRATGPVPPLPAAELEAAAFLAAVVAQVAAGQSDEYVLQADVPGGQAGQRPLQGLELVEQGGDGSMGLGDGQRVSLAVDPGREHGIEPGEDPGAPAASPLPSSANSTMWSPPRRAISSRGEPMRDDLAVVDDRHAVAEPLGLVHVVGRQQDGPAAVAQITDHVPELAPRLRVQASGRLVEEEQLGVADQGDGDGQPLLLAAGKLLDQSIGLGLQRNPRDGLVGRQAAAGRSCGRRSAARARSPCRETGSPGGSRRSAPGWRPGRRSPSCAPAPRPRRRSAGSSPSRISTVVVLPAPLGPKQAEALADVDLQVDAVDREDRAIAARVLLAQFLDANGPIAHGRRLSLEASSPGSGPDEFVR